MDKISAFDEYVAIPRLQKLIKCE